MQLIPERPDFLMGRYKILQKFYNVDKFLIINVDFSIFFSLFLQLVRDIVFYYFYKI